MGGRRSLKRITEPLVGPPEEASRSNSKAVITGDITQIDIPKTNVSGLVEVQDVLRNLKGIEFVYFSEKDVVRHPLVQDVIKAYEIHERKKREA